MAQIIDGKATAAKLRSGILAQVEVMRQQGSIPGLAVILVGEDPASQVYVRNKEKACEDCGFYSEKHLLSTDASEQELLDLIEKLNCDPRINGILCQLPLPKHMNEDKVILAIDPKKDVDAFHPINVGRIMTGDILFAPCTPAGVMTLLEEYGIDPKGKKCVVIGRSNIVGKPQAMLLLHKHGTVTICHSKTPDLPAVCREADILVCAIGKPRFVTAEYVKDGAVVIDVGINRDENGKLCGDADFASVEPKASYITPVPGGVGPMTIATLMQNTLLAAKLQRS